MLEVCIDSLESTLNAIHGGADELEICSCLSVGGLTPTVGLVREILLVVQNIGTGKFIHSSCVEGCKCADLLIKPKVNLMIRCNDNADFVYTELEMDTMLADIDIFKTMNIDRFVFGALNQQKEIHKEYCDRVIEKCKPFPATFHRAFDICESPMQSLEIIIKYGFTRLLTSGQAKSLNSLDAYNLIKQMNQLFGDKIDIMPGAGLSKDNAKKYNDLGCKIVHGSCTGGSKFTKELIVSDIKTILNR